VYVELSFSNSCLKSSLLSAADPALYAAAITRPGGDCARRKTGQGANEAATGSLDAAAAARWIKRSGSTISPGTHAWLYMEEEEECEPAEAAGEMALILSRGFGRGRGSRGSAASGLGR
jgi:hypothetical protein